MTLPTFAEIARVLPEATLLIGDGRIIAANPPALRLLGAPAKHVQGKLLADLVTQPPEEVQRYLSACARSRQFVLGTLTLRVGHGHEMPCRCDGAVVRPWTRESPALLMLRLSRIESASRRFVLLNTKIDELAREVHIRRQAEARLTLLAEASARMARSLDLEETLESVADIVVPHLADWCLVVLLSGDELAHLAAAHKDASEVDHVRALGRHCVLDRRMPFGVLDAIRSGESMLLPEVVPASLPVPRSERDPCALGHQVGLESMMTIPMLHGRVRGAVILVRSDAAGHYDEADLMLAEELVRRALMELDNAQLYREAEQARWQAEEMNRLKSAFLANMSHEIRTPLTAMIGFASLLAESVTPEARTYAERITSGGRRLLDTLNAVLALAQFEAEGVTLDPEWLVVADEVREAVVLLEREAQQKDLTLQFRVAPGADEVKARLDRGAFSSIIHNVVGNAIKYTSAGQVLVTVVQDAGQVAVEVKDTGAGIDPAFLPHIFDPFRQESIGWDRAHEGAGLGLSITKRLVEHMDGQITVESTKGQGSRFTISFPRAVAHQPTASSTLAVRTSPGPSDKKKETHILVVEDNPDTQAYMSILLQRVGEVHVASDAEEALAKVRQQLDSVEGNVASSLFDLILLDINLGNGADGIEVLKSLRALTRVRSVPVAAVTGYALPGDRERLLAEGFDAYLAKPFEPFELLDLTTHFLGEQ